MYMPDISYAESAISLGDDGAIILFSGNRYGGKTLDPEAYAQILAELKKAGSHRNVFRVDQNGLPVWRIADYSFPEDMPDFFVSIQLNDSDSKPSDCGQPNYLSGQTINGNVFRISMDDGSLERIAWVKE